MNGNSSNSFPTMKTNGQQTFDHRAANARSRFIVAQASRLRVSRASSPGVLDAGGETPLRPATGTALLPSENHRCVRLTLALTFALATVAAHAGWPNATVINVGSEWPDPLTTSWPANAHLNGDAAWNSTYKSLWLVPQSASKAGSLVLDMPQSGQTAQAFYAEWRAKLQPGTSGGGDGYSFCYGDLAANAVPPETGWGSLIVRYLTYGSDRIEVVYQGTVLRTYNLAWPFGNWTKNRVQVRGNGSNFEVKVEWQDDGDGVDSWTTVLDWTALSGWNPASHWRFAFGARNGNAYQYVELRETKILTIPSPAPGAPIVTTGSANPIGGTQAQLNGTVNPNGASTTAKHQLQESGAWVSGASAGVGRGVSLDGVDDYVSFPAAAWVDYDLSIEGWVYLREYNLSVH